MESGLTRLHCKYWMDSQHSIMQEQSRINQKPSIATIINKIFLIAHLCFTFLFSLGFLIGQNLVRSLVFIDYIEPNALCGPKNFPIDW